jgi:glycosyltransferase involved in cell wall biosynthesis
MKILMLSATFPYPPTRGGTQVRTFNLIKYLSQRHDITLITQRSPDVTDSEIEELRQAVTELVVFPRPQATAGQSIRGKLKRFGTFLVKGTPPSVLSIYSPEMQNWVNQAVQAGKFAAVTCEHSVNEIYVKPEWRSQLRTIVNIHSSVYGTCKNQLETGTSENGLRDRLNLPLLQRYERQYCGKFSTIVATTEEDRDQLQWFSPKTPIAVIPNGVDFSAFPYRAADPGGHRLIFIGAMDNTPNIDAVCFFSQEVFPKLQALYPDVTLELVGARPVPQVQQLGDRPGIVVTGKVPSMAEYLHRATVCVVPMRTGFGIKNKTLEAMAAGVPVVGSDRGLEGLAVDGENDPLTALRANQVEEYVNAISRLLENPELRGQLSKNGRSLVENTYTWEQAGERYEQAIVEG